MVKTNETHTDNPQADGGTATRDVGTRLDDLEAENAALQAEVDELTALLDGASREEIDGHDTLLLSNMNLQLVNGEGATRSRNGLGNLIIGYNEQRSNSADRRRGSHYLVVGDQHEWTAFGGIVAGLRNTASGVFATVTGGRNNAALGNVASVSGGNGNTASGPRASVSGGGSNTASNFQASVSGGGSNTASSFKASVSGGEHNTAEGPKSSILGGNDITVTRTHDHHP